MSGKKNAKYSREFKQTIVNLYHSGKTYSQIHQEYRKSYNALANWIKQYSQVQIDDNTVLLHGKSKHYRREMLGLRKKT